MTEVLSVIKDFLFYLLPAGGLGGVIVWIFNKKIRRAKSDKEVHDAYKAMYDDVKEEIKEIRNENKYLHKELARVGAIVSTIEVIVAKAADCVHYAGCPIRLELQQLQTHQRKNRIRQPSGKRTVRKTTNPDTGVEGQPSDTGDGSAEASAGIGIHE